MAHDDRMLIRQVITHKDTWAEGQELILEEFLQRILWVLSDVQHVMLSNLMDVHGVYRRISEVRVLLTNEDSQLVASFISSVQGKRNPQDQTTYIATSSVFLLLQCCSSSRSDRWLLGSFYLLLPGTIHAGVYIEVYKFVGRSFGWCRSMQSTVPHSCCFLPSRW
jgi:hypothetical protein